MGNSAYEMVVNYQVKMTGRLFDILIGSLRKNFSLRFVSHWWTADNEDVETNELFREWSFEWIENSSQ